MAIENDTRDNGVSDQDNNDVQNQQQDQQQQDQRPDPSDVALDKLMETTDVDRAGAQGKDKTQQGKPGTQQQQDDTNQQRGTQQGRQGNAGGGDVQQGSAAARKFGNSFFADQRGDIYSANGQLVAKQGYGRSVFHKMYPFIEQSERELATLRNQVSSYDNANKLAKDNNLSMAEHGAALQLMVQWKKDPKKTLNDLLQVAQDRGIDLTDIRQGGGTVDVSAFRTSVQDIVKEALAPFMPFVEQRQQDAQERELNDQVMTEYTDFMQRFPDARAHEESIANVMRDHGMSHTEAYFAVKAFAAENGLDFSKPLKEQVLAAAQRGPSGDGNNRRLPQMRGRTQGDGVTADAGSRGMAGAEESWDAIARRTMAQHGLVR